MLARQRISPCLWFDSEAEEAAAYYTGIFKDSKILHTARYGKAGHEIHGRAEGSVMTVAFELEGQEFLALNGGPLFRFSEAVSFQIFCKDQREIDYFWNALGAGGDSSAQQCGWLKDRFGLSWQVVPARLPEMLQQATAGQSERVMTAILKMKKLDLAELERAFGA